MIACVLSRHECCRALAWSIGRREGFCRFRRQISPLGSSLLHCRCWGPSHAQQLSVGAVHVEVGVIFVRLTCARVAFSKIPAACLPSPPPAPSTGSSAAKQPPGGQAPCRWCRGHAVSHGSDTQACFPIPIPSGKRPARAASAARVGFAVSPPPPPPLSPSRCLPDSRAAWSRCCLPGFPSNAPCRTAQRPPPCGLPRPAGLPPACAAFLRRPPQGSPWPDPAQRGCRAKRPPSPPPSAPWSTTPSSGEGPRGRQPPHPPPPTMPKPPAPALCCFPVSLSPAGGG